MKENSTPLINTCNIKGIEPIMMDLPYPTIQVQERNREYANLLSVDYCGSVSELSAITQYINNENRLTCDQCPIAKTILGIAVAEMIHLHKLGELIFLLGGTIEFVAKYQNGRQRMWTPQYLKVSDNMQEMLRVGIEGEKDAIEQYERHIKIIKDEYVIAVLRRIIQDEEYHIMLLENLLKENS